MIKIVNWRNNSLVHVKVLNQPMEILLGSKEIRRPHETMK